jgi:uncharacterized protein
MPKTKEWRSVCRQYAEEQGLKEARKAWKLDADQPVPFNHRWEHVQEVVKLALGLAGALDADLEIVEAAAWLHDISKDQPKHALVGAVEAQHILATTDFPAAKIVPVASVIRQHEGLFRPAEAAPLEPVEAAILWDADKLSKLGVQALAFLLSAEYLAGLTLAERRLNCEKYVLNTLSRTVASMNTSLAQQAATQRYRHMRAMLDTWAEEELLYNSQ